MLLAIIAATPWGTNFEMLHDSAFIVGFALTALAIFCNVGPLFGGRWTWKIGARKSEDPAGGSD